MRDEHSVYDGGSSRKSGGGRGCFVAFVLFMLIAIAGAGAAAYYYMAFEPQPSAAPHISENLRKAASRYGSLGEFYDGVAQVTTHEGSIRYIDTDGVEMPPPDGSHHTHEPDATTLYRVEKGGRWGMIDRVTGDTVIRPIYSSIGNFYDGFALATLSSGDPSMPEYRIFYGYVDTYGDHTFTQRQFDDIADAAKAAERRAYEESLPKGVTLTTLGLPDKVMRVEVMPGDGGRTTLTFSLDGILERYSRTDSASTSPQRRYEVTDGMVTRATTASPETGTRVYRYILEKIDDRCSDIICIGSDHRRRVGTCRYSAADGRLCHWSFEDFPALSGGETTATDNAGRPTRLDAATFTATITYYGD